MHTKPELIRPCNLWRWTFHSQDAAYRHNTVRTDDAGESAKSRQGRRVDARMIHSRYYSYIPTPGTTQSIEVCYTSRSLVNTCIWNNNQIKSVYLSREQEEIASIMAR